MCLIKVNSTLIVCLEKMLFFNFAREMRIKKGLIKFYLHKTSRRIHEVSLVSVENLKVLVCILHQVQVLAV